MVFLARQPGVAPDDVQEDGFQVFVDAFPVDGGDPFPGRGAKALAQFRLCRQTAGGGNEFGFIARGGQQPRAAVLDHFPRRRTTVGQYRQCAGHGFQGDIAEGLGEAGEQEQVTGGIVGSQVFAAAHAGKVGLRPGLGQTLAGRSVTHQDQPGIRAERADGLEGLEGQGQVLFRRQTADHQHRQAIGPQAPFPAQALGAATGMEQLAIHPPGQDLQIGVALLAQVPGHFGGGHESGGGAVVETFQVAGHGLLQPAYAVMAAVMVEIGVKARCHGQLQLVGHGHRRSAQGAFGGHMDQVRGIVGPVLLQPPTHG